MKVDAYAQPKPFTPVAITITCETQVELDTLGSLFNNATVAARIRVCAPGFKTMTIVNTVKEAGGDIARFCAYLGRKFA